VGQRRPGQTRRQIAASNELRHQVTRRDFQPGPPFFALTVKPIVCAAVTPSPSPNSRSELFTQLAVACIGAGVVTSVAVAQGQNPLTALGITLFSAVAAVMVGQIL
jgi:hypothetical protein